MSLNGYATGWAYSECPKSRNRLQQYNSGLNLFPASRLLEFFAITC